MKSWKTTVGGLFLGLGLIFSQLGTLFDDDPNTNPNWELVAAGGGAIVAGVAARDNGVSSEDAGAK